MTDRTQMTMTPAPLAPEAAGPVLAALDLGTNNCRLLIAHGAGNDFRVVDSFSRIVRLGEGIAEGDGALVLGDAAMHRTLNALDVCARKIRRHHVDHARFVATEACRRAANADDFLARVRRRTGLALEIIDCREEACLGAAGCAPLFDPAARFVLQFDIGGGSTELSWVAVSADGAHRVVACMSLSCGVSSLSRFHDGGVCPDQTYQAMVAHVGERMRPFIEVNGIAEEIASGAVQMVGTSGTVTTLAGLHFGLSRYDRSQVDGSVLDFDTVLALIRRVAALDYEDRAALPCVGRARADLLVCGCALVEAICRLCPVGKLSVGDRGVREGILYALAAAAAAATVGSAAAGAPT